MIQFRPARPDDADAIVEIVRKAFARAVRELALTLESSSTHPSLYTRERLESDQARGRCFHVLEKDGLVVGCVYVRKAGEELCEVGRLAVRPEMQGRGLGERLMREAEGVARSRGSRRVNIDAFSELTRLVKWYESLGYVIDAIESIAGIPRPVVRMHKRLDVDAD